MKQYSHIFLLLIILLITNSCKQDNWLDWKLQNEIFMEQNAKRAEIHTTPSGLQYEVLYQGNVTDTKPGSTSIVYVDYKGSLINGAVFDQGNYSPITLSTSVEGFVEGMRHMNVDADYIIYIPWEIGYGEEGTEDIKEGGTSFIPPYSTLIFNIHLIAVQN